MLKKELLDFLKKTPWQNFENSAVIGISLADNAEYTNYVTFIQDSLNKFYPFRNIVSALAELREDPRASKSVKEKIERIFAKMDPRDAHFRDGKECGCSLCTKKPYQLLYQLIFPQLFN